MFLNIMLTWIAVIALAFSSAPAVAGSPYAAPVHDVLKAYHNAGLFRGTALVALRGEVVYRGAFGMANEEWQIPNTPETRMDVGSIGKTFTALAVLRLVQAGEIDLDETIDRYLPDVRGDLASRITVRQLLQHTSGIRRDVFDDSDLLRLRHSSGEILRAINSSELQFEPDTESEYSNAGYVLAAMVVESVTGRSFPDALHELVLVPAELVNTGTLTHERIIPEMASGYDIVLGRPIPAEPVEYRNGSGPGGVYSTVDDLYRLDRVLKGHDFLSEGMKAQMYDRREFPHGLGWRVRHLQTQDAPEPLLLLHHNGDHAGFSSHYFRFPDEELVIVLLSNQNLLPRTALFNAITNVLNDAAPPDTIVAVSKTFYLSLHNGDPSSLVDRFAELRSDKSVPDRPTMYTVHDQGYHLMRCGDLDGAEHFFRFNTIAYPESWLGYVALGDLYEFEGRDEAAREWYGRALELDPANPYATRALREIGHRSKP